jgi:protein-tyrosine-phosphatase
VLQRAGIEAQGALPAVFRLAGHPVRWRLLTALAAGDRRVGELATALRVRQNLASYHLGQLRRAELVHAHRSAADARDLYYRLDLDRMRSMLGVAAGSLHPALAAPAGPPAARHAGRGTRVCFLCTGNSARSQMAEALLRELGGGAVAACSAGSHPAPLAERAVRAMRRRGIDISGQRSKHLDELVTERFDYVISLCDRVREVCPEFPSHPCVLHWSIPDPSAEVCAADDDAPFERTVAELETRIGFLLHVLASDALPSEVPSG